jgi:hypothetical protein
VTRLRRHISYANVMATIAVFIALGGTSYAVLHIGSEDVADNSLRSRDIRNNTVRGRDIRDHTLRARDLTRNSLGGGVIKESSLGTVPSAGNAERVGGATTQDLRVKCPLDTAAQAGVCIETTPRSPDGFLGASDRCDQIGRGLVTVPQLDRFARTRGPLSQPEWTGSVYRNAAGGAQGLEQFEAVVLEGGGNPSHDQVYKAVQHAFRCVALPSN